MSLPTLPTSLSSLSLHDAVTDGLLRAVIGLDTNNAEIFNSAFTDESNVTINGRTLRGRADLNSGLFQRIGPLTTTHFISNIRVNVQQSATTASLTACSLAQHYRPGKGFAGEEGLLTGAMYYVDLIKDADGLWKVCGVQDADFMGAG